MAPTIKWVTHHWHHLLTGLLAVLAALAGIRFTSVWPVMEAYLDVGTEPQPAEYIVVLDGRESRYDYAAELYADGYAPQIITGILSIGRNTQHRKRLMALNVPPEAIIPNCCGTSTWEEASAHLQLLQMLGAESAIITSNWQHTRRARAIYEHLIEFHRLDIDLIYVSAPFDGSTFASDRFVLREYFKMVYYRLRYGVNSFAN